MIKKLEQEMLKLWGSFDTTVKLVVNAKQKAQTRRYKALIDTIDTAFFKFDEEFRLYKAEVIKKESNTDAAFNAIVTDQGVTKPVYYYNDNWYEVELKRYMDTKDLLQDELDLLEDAAVSDQNSIAVDIEFAVQEIKMEFEQIEAAVTKLDKDIKEFEDSTMMISVAQGYKELIASYKHSIDTDLKEKVMAKLNIAKDSVDPDYSNANLRTKFMTFCKTNKESLDRNLIELVKKMMPEVVTPLTENKVDHIIGDASSDRQNLAMGRSPREQVYLEKTKPPKFNGDELEFPEFKRKWASQVSKAYLPEETELDKLRDAVPKEAKDQLYGVTSLTVAWEILVKRYGDKLLISKKLKSQLKGIQCVGKSDPERIINLKVKVRNIVTRLETLGMNAALEHDSEFLSAVYTALPDRHRVRWLDYEKGEEHWDAMLKFLDRAYEQANQELALLSVYKEDRKPNDKQVKAGGAQVGGDPRDSGDQVGGNSGDNNDRKEAKKKAKDSCGKCPACDQFHSFQRRDGWWPSDRFITCKKFRDMNLHQRSESIEKAKGCSRCTSWNHAKPDCRMKENNCGFDLGANIKCKQDHSKLLHGTTNVYCSAVRTKVTAAAAARKSSCVDAAAASNFSCVDEEQETIFYFQEVPVKRVNCNARVFWDTGSNRVLIREGYAHKNKLEQRDVTYSIKVVGHEPKTVRSKIYLVDIIDMYGNVHAIWGYGTPSIMQSYTPDMSAIQSLFPHVPDKAFAPLPDKEVDILIGLNKNEIHPAGGLGNDKVGGLKALRSLFGSGWVIGGHHENIPSNTSAISADANMLRVAKIQIEPTPSLTPEFWESEGMGVLPPPRCDNCKGCMVKGPCSEKQYSHSAQRQAELDLIREKTRLKNGEIWCEYPFIKDPSCLKNNRPAAIKVAGKIEKDLIRDGLYEVYNEQIRDFLKRGVAVKLSNEEMESWTGPCQYITHHAVLKDSVTTPCRVVTNSSFNNGGKSLNSCLAKGPNSLNPMLNVMLRYRCHPVGLQFDLSKAYNTLRTGPVERHLRRFVWRFNPGDDWQDFALDRVHFGDQCAATELEVGKDITADEGAHIDPEAAKRIKEEIYVDDGLTGGSAEQVNRFVGKKLPDGQYDGTIPRILALGNFKVKAFSISGQEPTEESDLMGNKVLGYKYDLQGDMLAVTFPLNLSRKKRSVHIEPNLTSADIAKLKPTQLTKRLLLGATNGFGDFLGIASPFTIRYKTNMREIFLQEEPVAWDEVIPEHLRDGWINLLMETLQSGDLSFPRCARPPNAVKGKGPVLIGTCDFGVNGYDARVYLRWELEEAADSGCDNCAAAGSGCNDCSEQTATATYGTRLAICKVRVPPLQGLTVPRGELSSLLMLSRLMLAVVSALKPLDNPPTSGIMLSDSKCSISSVYSSKVLLPYFQNRVAEIKDNMLQFRKNCPLEEIHYVESALNPSDISTKGTVHIWELGPDSFHQTGPYFFSLSRMEWPVTQIYTPEEIPESEFKVRNKCAFTAAARLIFCYSGIYQNNPWTVTEELIHYSDKIKKVLNIIARYVRGLNSDLQKSGSLKFDNPAAYELLAAEPTRAELQKAERMLLLHGMPHTKEALDSGKLDSLLPLWEGRIIVTRGRLNEKSLDKLLGVSSLPILMSASRVAYLYMMLAHCGEYGLVHRSAVATLARSRRKVWIVRGRDLARRVVNSCPRCIKDRKELLMQQMAEMKEESTTVAPPWRHVALDFAGPLIVKGEVNSRAKLKVWVLVYTCRATKAVCLLATSGYSTADFLSKHEEFVFRHGRPDSVISDRGSQLVAAGIVIANKDLPEKKLDWKKVISVNHTTDWKFVPVGGQHQNGLSEATVKVMKKSLSLAIHPSTELSYSELVTLLARISYSINSRPLTLRNESSNSQQEDNMLPITPNQLLLGRSSIEVPDLEYDESNKFSARLSYVQQVHQSWWERWIQDVLPTLVPCKRWKEIKKNLKVDDIVLMKYDGNMKDDYRLAKVTEVFKDEKGLVRKVRVSFRRRDKRESRDVYWKKPLSNEIVAVQRLSLLQAAGEPTPDGSFTDQLPLDASGRLDSVKASLTAAKSKRS